MATLITGAGGFLGSHLRQAFSAAGHDVRAVDLPGVADMDGACDITDDGQVAAAVQGCETVIHAAGIFDLAAPEALLQAVNADGAARVAEAAVAAGAKRLVLISSSSVYGRGADQVPESSDKKPEHAYARTKWEGERRVSEIAQDRGLSLAVLRPTLLYGPGSRYGLAPWAAIFAIRRLKGAGALPIAKGGPLGHMVHVQDVAEATVHVADSDEQGAFNVSDHSPVPAGDLVRLIAQSVGAPVSGSPLPWSSMRVFRRAKPLLAGVIAKQNAKLAHLWQRTVADHELVPALSPRMDPDWIDFLSADHTYNSAALRATGFEFKHPDARVSLPATIDWYRENRWIPAA